MNVIKVAVGIFLFTWTGLNIVQFMLLFFLKYRMNLEAASDMVAGTVFISALITLPIWEYASRKLDKRKAYIAGMIFLSAVMITLIVIDPSWGIWIVYMLAALAGVGVAAVHVLPWSMIPDAVEVDELETGERREGVYNGIFTFIRKAGGATAYMVAGVALSLSGFDRSGAEQPDAALTTIRVTTCIMPSLFLLGALILARGYPLGRDRHAQILGTLGRKNAGDPTGGL